jgi:hypothetical protein
MKDGVASLANVPAIPFTIPRLPSLFGMPGVKPGKTPQLDQ